MTHTWIWRLFAGPGLIWLALFFFVPFYAVLCVAFGQIDPILQTPLPELHPLRWEYGDFISVVRRFVPGGEYVHIFGRTVLYVVSAVVGCFAIGYPVAYYISRHAKRSKALLLTCLILPLWVSYQMRMLAWVNLFSPTGYVNKLVLWSGISSGPVEWLGHSYSVIFGLIYGYVPYLIIPLLASLDRIDKNLLEAARDLGAGPFTTFFKVLLPLSLQGIFGAAIIIALPMFGDYYTANLVSGSPRTSMIGNQIEVYFHGGPQPSTGASLTLLLATFLAMLMTYYLVQLVRSSSGSRQ